MACVVHKLGAYNPVGEISVLSESFVLGVGRFSDSFRFVSCLLGLWLFQ